MRKRYFFFDIDGTLAAGPIANRRVPESAAFALQHLREQGHFTAICTGRGYAMALPYLKEYGFSDMVCDGGNGIVLDGVLRGVEPLDREACIRVLEECDRLGWPWALSCDLTRRRYTRVPEFDDLAHDAYMDTVVDPNLDYHAIDCFYKLFLPCTEREEAPLSSLSFVPTARFSPYVLFVEPVDKGNGVKRVMDVYGADYADAVVFGDGSNDISMFLPEWTCVAMGNAIDELKARADFVTTDVDKDGILNACRHYGWVS